MPLEVLPGELGTPNHAEKSSKCEFLSHTHKHRDKINEAHFYKVQRARVNSAYDVITDRIYLIINKSQVLQFSPDDLSHYMTAWSFGMSSVCMCMSKIHKVMTVKNNIFLNGLFLYR